MWYEVEFSHKNGEVKLITCDLEEAKKFIEDNVAIYGPAKEVVIAGDAVDEDVRKIIE